MPIPEPISIVEEVHEAQALRGSSVHLTVIPWEGPMPTYVVGMNVIAFIVSFWSAVIYVVWTRDWIGSALWLTLGFALLTSRRLTPRRE